MRLRHSIQFAFIAVLVSSVSVAVAQAQQASSAAPVSSQGSLKTGVVPVTTSSAEARRNYEMGLVRYEDLLFMDEGLRFFRQSVKDDPSFALGHATLGYTTSDPTEEQKEQALAVKFIATASPDEQLLIRWMNGTKNGDLVPGIAALNDLLAKYPNDKRLENMAGEWFCTNQQAYEHGEAVLVRLLKNDPKYFPAMNNLAYCYALSGRPALAPVLMEEYVVALPKQPNPQDSYGEIMRMQGDYPAALDHYRKALQMDPTFVTSQVGIASTYALMGDQQRARAEYMKAISMTKEHPTQFAYRTLWAMTYYRENQLDQAHREYTKLAAEAFSAGFAVQESEVYRTMALFDIEPNAALKDLDTAQAVLSQKNEISRGDRDEQVAKILQTRAFVAARSGMPDIVQKAFESLSAMAQTSRSNPVQDYYHSANGAALLAHGKYAAAIPELEEDDRNPLSLQLLADAQNKAGQSANAQKTLAALAAINDERIETAAAVPQARAALKAANSPTTALATTR